MFVFNKIRMLSGSALSDSKSAQESTCTPDLRGTKGITTLNKRQSLTELIGTLQPRSLVPIRRNQSRNFETILLKLVITEIRHP
jgi:hypothetical protein